MSDTIVDPVPILGVDGDFRKLRETSITPENTILLNDVITLLSTRKGDLYLPGIGLLDYFERMYGSTESRVEVLLTQINEELETYLSTRVEITTNFDNINNTIEIKIFINGLSDIIVTKLNLQNTDPTVKPTFFIL